MYFNYYCHYFNSYVRSIAYKSKAESLARPSVFRTSLSDMMRRNTRIPTKRYLTKTTLLGCLSKIIDIVLSIGLSDTCNYYSVRLKTFVHLCLWRYKLMRVLNCSGRSAYHRQKAESMTRPLLCSTLNVFLIHESAQNWNS